MDDADLKKVEEERRPSLKPEKVQIQFPINNSAVNDG